MNDTRAVDRAVKRLADALDTLDAAIELRLEDDRRRATLGEQVHAFSIDRARLASELDGAEAHARELETVNREAARHLDEAMDAIRAVIAANQG
jgi:L-lactate utilization protein LutB